MAGYDYDIGIIGGGAAGLTVASGASQLGAKTLLVEQEDRLGGDCLHFGCVPSKALINTARTYFLMRNAHTYGLPAMTPPPVDFKLIADHIRRVIATIQRHDSEERFCGLGVKVQYGRPRFADEHCIDLDGQQLTAKQWVIATGSSPMIPPIPGLEDTTFWTNRDLFSLDHLPESLIILGAGPIGIEMAQAFTRLGARVSVIDRADQILIKEDRDLADTLQAELAEEGVTFHLSAEVTDVEEKHGSKVVRFNNDRGMESRIEARALLVAAGRVPNIATIGLDAIGVETHKSGIAVDRRMRTSQKHIFAAGDVTGGFQFTHAAGYEGGIVLSNAIFHLPRKADYTHLPWCTYCDPELASIGMNEKAAERAGIKATVWREPFAANDRAIAEHRSAGQIKLLLDSKEKPIGVQILGPRAGDLIGEWVAALNGHVRLSTLAGAIHPYPTLVEINKKVTGSIFAPKLFSEKMQKGLKFFFNLKGRACTLEA